MGLRRSSHAVYDAVYHLLWCPKYRKQLFRDKEIRERAEHLIREISEEYEMEIEEMEVAIDPVHILISFHAKYSIGQVVRMIKSISARELFREFPRIKKRLWAGGLWEDGYFARTVGDRMTRINTLSIIETLSKGLRSFFKAALRCPVTCQGEFHLGH